MNDEEIWKSVPGTEFEASSWGRLRKIITPYAHSKGYLQVKVGFGRESKNFYVHRMVAAAFHGVCPNGLEVNHRDLDKHNNRPENLEYTTHQENQQHMTDAGRNYLVNRGKKRGESSRN